MTRPDCMPFPTRGALNRYFVCQFVVGYLRGRADIAADRRAEFFSPEYLAELRARDERLRRFIARKPANRTRAGEHAASKQWTTINPN